MALKIQNKKNQTPCFIAKTKVLTMDGYKNIADIKVGEFVLTHKNRFQKVLATNGHWAYLYELKIGGFPSVFVSPNHLFLIKEKRDSEPIWKPLCKISQTDCFLMHSFNAMSTKHNQKSSFLNQYKNWLYTLKQNNSHYQNDEYICFHFDYIRPAYEENLVYNILVEEDSSYIAENMIVLDNILK